MPYLPGRMLAALIGALAVWLAIAAVPARAEPDYPAFTGLVVDDAHVLSDADRAAITGKLEALQAKAGIQFAVATVGSLGGEEIEPYANALFRKWKIGRKDVNDGLLLILAPKERKLRFEVGYGLEGTFTDVQSKLILHNTMVPKLKAGDPASALKGGVQDAIIVLTKGAAGSAGAAPAQGDQASAGASDAGADGPLVNLILLAMPALFILIVLVVIVQTLRGKMRWTRGGYIGGATGGWSSGDSSSSSGGGDSFSGGGGGDSGGGGASDSY